MYSNVDSPLGIAGQALVAVEDGDLSAQCDPCSEHGLPLGSFTRDVSCNES